MHELEEAIKENPQLLIEALGLDLEVKNNKVVCSCFLHGGDGQSALNINFDIGYWKCYSRKCERTFYGSLLGFTRAALSHQKLNWRTHGDQIYPWVKTLDYVKSLYGLTDKKFKEVDREQQLWCSQVSNREISQRFICSREKFIKNIKIPSEYFLNRGFSKEVLIEFDVGSCLHNNSYLGGRSVVPTYDISGREVLGISGRTEKNIDPKWKHTKGFPSSTILYNIWGAKDFIKKTNTAIIVEGPADVWRLWEAGYKNAVALYGGNLSSAKHLLLDQLGVMNITLCLDEDEAGNGFADNIEKTYGALYNIQRLRLPCKDFGEMTPADIKKILK